MEKVKTNVNTNLFNSVSIFIFSAMVLLSLSAGAAHHMEEENKEEDIIDVAVANGSFNTLAAALTAAGLIDALKAEGPYTVFAPTDEAFAKLPAGTVESLLKPENIEKLKAILTYHVVAGKVMAADVAGLTKATTLNGSDIAIKTADGSVMINNSKVILADVAASNGVIHVVDTVILPPTS